MSSDSKEKVRDVPFSVEVDNTLESILIVLSAKGNPGITLINPSGKFAPMKSLYVLLQYSYTGLLPYECVPNAISWGYLGKWEELTDDPNRLFSGRRLDVWDKINCMRPEMRLGPLEIILRSTIISPLRRGVHAHIENGCYMCLINRTLFISITKT